MDTETELRMLQALRADSPLTVNEIDVAAEQIMSDDQRDQDLELQSRKAIKIQVELARLDRQWVLKRQKHTGFAPGKPFVPSKTACLMLGIPGFLFGLAWVSFAFGSSESLGGAQFSLADSIFPYVGIVVTAILFCCVSYLYKRKAGRYEKDKKAYWHQRDLLVAQQSML